MSGKLKQPDIEKYIHWLSSNDNFGMYANRYDDKSFLMFDELFSLIDQIAPTFENGARSLWFTAERGTIEEFNIDKKIENGTFDSREEAIDYWNGMYPNKIEWYAFGAVEDKKTGYRTIFLDHRCVIVVDPQRDVSGFEQEISPLVEWLIEKLKECIRMLKDGTYNEYVKNNLPPQHRTGTIKRKDFWDIWPEHRNDFFKNISKDDVEEFIRLAKEQPEKTDLFSERMPHMTANDFFRCCALGYAANHYHGCDKTPKEQYYIHADGRDEGLEEIDPDSEEAFIKWLNRDRRGGHPWEVCSGGNSTHIDLGVRKDEYGFFLYLAGKAWTRTVETAHFFLALRRAGLPVFLYESKALADRMAEEEYIGIVPEGVIPAYCESDFPDEHIIDFMNLPYEDREKFLPFCHWQPIKPVSLLKDDQSNDS